MWRTTETEKKFFNILSKVGDTFIIFDCETTGFGPKKDRIIQISAKKYLIKDNYTLHLISELNEYINPGFYISEKITELTGITNDFLEDKPLESEIFPLIYDFFGEAPYCTAYNSRFDLGFLNEMYERNGASLQGKIFGSKGALSDLETAIDTLKIAKDLVDKDDTEDFKLQTICNLYGAGEGIDWHRADADVEATSRLIPMFISEYLAKHEEEKDVEKNKDIAKIISVRFWEGFRGYSRIYVNTNIGVVFYDVRNKAWGEKDKGALDKINMEQLRTDVLSKEAVKSEEELSSKLAKLKK